MSANSSLCSRLSWWHRFIPIPPMDTKLWQHGFLNNKIGWCIRKLTPRSGKRKKKRPDPRNSTILGTFDNWQKRNHDHIDQTTPERSMKPTMINSSCVHVNKEALHHISGHDEKNSPAVLRVLVESQTSGTLAWKQRVAQAPFRT